MKKENIESLSGQTLFVGIDVHKKSFHVTLRTFDCDPPRPTALALAFPLIFSLSIGLSLLFSFLSLPR